MRRAKIVCTLGPASSSPEILREMIKAGMNVARLNFSHGTHEFHREMHDRIRSLSEEMRTPIAILQDLQGPKIRVGRFTEGSVELTPGSRFIITAEDIEGNAERVSTTYKTLPDDVRTGDILLLDDGLLRLNVLEVIGGEVHTEVEIGGILKNNKGINLPTAAVSSPSLTPKDIEDLEFGLELGVDYLALSFVRSALDIHQLRARIPKDNYVKIISKIEKPQAVAHIEEIISVSDGIMIARGDLGVELPPQSVPVIQKRAIERANALGRISITATQMLESMTDNVRPTRAEASDVANAVLDGTDAVMLSGETASGKYPVEAVQMMASIIEEIETSPIYRAVPTPHFIEHLRTFPNAVAKSAAMAADELGVLGIVVLTVSGKTARLMMTYRPNKPIIGCTPSLITYRQMALYWGVSAHHVDIWNEGYVVPDPLEESLELGAEATKATSDILTSIETLMITEHGARIGDEMIVVMGYPIHAGTETNLLKFHRVT